MNFADRLLREIDKKENIGIVGLDPDVEFIPQHIQDEGLDKFLPRTSEDDFRAEGFALFEFNKRIIDAVADVVPAVKQQIAFYEIYKAPGIVAFDETIKYGKGKGLVVIEDGKRNDVGNTARKYSEGHLGRVKLLRRRDEARREVPSLDLDALTVNGYLGSDCVLEFAKDCKNYGKGIFVLDKTSNPSAGEIQDEILESKIKLSERMAHLIENKWSEGTKGEENYKSVGAVVGATYADDARILRRAMPTSIFLVPGYGKAQGGRPEDIPNFVNKDSRGAIVNSSRDIIAAYREPKYLEKYGEQKFYKASLEEAIKMKEAITEALRKSEKSRW
jgi:orotidine-5'-phosphate decarboxylase